MPSVVQAVFLDLTSGLHVNVSKEAVLLTMALL
jgi:hypothetical protein